MQHIYRTSGTCSSRIQFDLDGDTVRNVSFTGGCNGNLQGIARVVDGMTVERINEIFSGIRCGMKRTSCPDQLAKAVLSAWKEENGIAE